MSLDFTLKKYALFCRTLQGLPYPVMTVKSFLDAGQPREVAVVLRHDIDRCMKDALQMARLEAQHDIRATYYVRMTGSVFKPGAIQELTELGHDVGYHYETLAKAKGNDRQAIEIFKEELYKLRRIASVDTISMHGSPLTPWNNLDLWETFDYRDFDIKGEFSLSIDYSDFYYFTDTGRRWDAGRYNLRDHVSSSSHSHTQRIHTTDDLIKFLKNTVDAPIFINTHPNRWASGPIRWCVGALSDFFINQIKWLVSRFRKSI